MRLMSTVVLIAGAGVVLAISGCAGCKGGGGKESPPKDTPIVAGGGSVYGCSYGAYSDGWSIKPHENYYSASLHADVLNPNGIDNLWFEGFVNNPAVNPVMGTNGWAVSISNQDGNGGNKLNAVRFCSDINCSAIKKQDDGSDNPNYCKAGSFSKNGNVYFEQRNGAQLDTKLLPMQIGFHDPSCSHGGTACDKVYDVVLETCTGGKSGPYKCQEDATGQKCRIFVGTDHTPPGCK